MEGEALFDAMLSDRARDNALRRVAHNVDTTWATAAERAIHTVAARQPSLTSDDVWQLLQTWNVAPPHEPRAMGAMMKRAQKQGWIKPTSTFKPTTRVQAHSSPTRVWQSEIWKP